MTPPRLTALPDTPLGVAVSGGGDSMALLMLLHKAGHTIRAATVDHQLRPESAQEAQFVADICASLGIAHEILRWDHDSLAGNVQQLARLARQNLLGIWAEQNGLKNIVLGHTLDDQAETILMRLARGSGVDGLSGMATKRLANRIFWHRPMLGITRATLREYLQNNGVPWVDDPSNDDEKYDRIKARKALTALAPLGIDAAGLAATSDHMRRARKTLDELTYDWANKWVSVSETGEVSLARDAFRLAPEEIQFRILATVLRWISSAAYRPRFKALSALHQSCLKDVSTTKTLHGCVISLKKSIKFNREVSAISTAPVNQRLWDGRWLIDVAMPANFQVKPLGAAGLQGCMDWRETGHSRNALLASPSLWENETLIAAPFANFGDKWLVNLAGGKKGFYDLFNTH